MGKKNKLFKKGNYRLKIQ